jgi:hypothetical protein
MSYVDIGDDGMAARELRRELVMRHLAWVNALRLQLRKTSRFFEKPARSTRRRLERHAEHMRNDWDRELAPFAPPDELAEVSAKANAATHLLAKQATRIATLVKTQRLDLFHQIAMTEPSPSCSRCRARASASRTRPSHGSTPSSAACSRSCSASSCRSGCSTCSRITSIAR